MTFTTAAIAGTAWFDRPEAEPPAWYRAQSDPVVGTAIRLIQNNPAEPWTVAAVAAEAGVSRAVLARRFNEQRIRGISPQEHRKLVAV